MQICEYFFENACYSVTKYYLCKQNNKRSLLGRKQRHQVVRSFPNHYLFSLTNKITSLFPISCILEIILLCDWIAMATPIFVKKAQVSVFKRFAKLSFFCPFFRPLPCLFAKKRKTEWFYPFFSTLFFLSTLLSEQQHQAHRQPPREHSANFWRRKERLSI